MVVLLLRIDDEKAFLWQNLLDANRKEWQDKLLTSSMWMALVTGHVNSMMCSLPFQPAFDFSAPTMPQYNYTCHTKRFSTVSSEIWGRWSCRSSIWFILYFFTGDASPRNLMNEHLAKVRDVIPFPLFSNRGSHTIVTDCFMCLSVISISYWILFKYQQWKSCFHR